MHIYLYFFYQNVFVQSIPELEVLKCDVIKEKMMKGEIVLLKPEIGTKNFNMYNVCHRLKSVSSQKAKPHYFFCIKCERVLNVNTSTHHNTLKRHFLKCSSVSGNISKGLYINFEITI